MLINLSDEYKANKFKSCTTEYFGADDAIKNPEQQNKNWSIKFDYRFNSLGFRCGELDYESDCLISFGCSHTVGVGVPENYRFPDLIANKLKLKHFSFAVGGSGIFQTFHNVVTFFKKDFKKLKVKKIIILWPNYSRIVMYQGSDKESVIIPAIVKESELDFFNAYHEKLAPYIFHQLINSIDLIAKSHNIEIYQMSMIDIPVNIKISNFIYDEKFYSNNYFKVLDRGRDEHFGIKTHQAISRLFLTKMN